MKKTKILMPIIGVAAIGTSIAPLTALTACSSQSFKVELSKGSKEIQLYANSKTLSLFFTQNDLENYAKTRVRMDNLKIDGAEVTSVAGLLKLAVDAAGGMRVTIDVETLFKHYSQPSLVEFDLVFHNRTTDAKCTVEGFKLSADQDTEVPNPFKTSSSDDKLITGFNDDTTASSFSMAAYAQAYPEVFVAITIPALSNTKSAELKMKKEEQPVEEEAGPSAEEKASEEESATTLYYKMVIPASFTGIDELAFYDVDKTETTMPEAIVSLDFAPNSKMSEIGAGAFQGNKRLLFVSLPKSIKTLGEACFYNLPYLQSIKFAPTNDNGSLVLPVGFIGGSSALTYLKLPNYITGIQTSTQKPIVPSIYSQTRLYLDFSDWNPTQLATLSEGLNNQSIQSDTGINLIATSEKVASDAIEILKKAEITTETQTAADFVIYSVKDLDSTKLTATLVLGGIDTSSVSEIAKTKIFVKTLSSISNNWLAKELEYPISRLELPNYYYNSADQKTYTINAMLNTVGGQLFCNSTMDDSLSSVVLPSNLVTIPTESFPGLDVFWQVYIPSTVSTIKGAAFAACSNLNSIVFGGTKAQWQAIDKTDTNPYVWNYDCSKITVTCTDGTITVNATNA